MAKPGFKLEAPTTSSTPLRLIMAASDHARGTLRCRLREVSRRDSPVETDSRLVVVRGWGRWAWGLPALWAWGFILGGMEVFGDQTGVTALQPCRGTKCPWIVHLKMVAFMFCPFHINN